MWLGHEAIAAALADEGVDELFGVMGVGNVNLIYDLVNQHSVRYHAARIEGGAVMMADGYSRVTQRLGVCAVTQGPGLTNTVTALTAATRYGSPVLVITGDMPAKTPRGSSQQIDQADVIAPTGADFVTLAADTDWYTQTRRLVRQVIATRRPLVLNLPNDLQPLPNPEPADRSSFDQVETNDVGNEAAEDGFDEAALQRAAELIANARMPLVLAGRGAIAARDAVLALAAGADALLGTTLLGKDLFVDEPWSIGIVGGFANANARQLLADVDCVISIGAGLNMWTTKQGTLLAGRTHVQCDIDPGVIARVGTADIGLVGDAADVAQALLKHLTVRTGVAARNDQVRAVLDSGPEDGGPASVEGTVHPRSLMRRLNELLPAARTLVSDGGHFVGFPAAGMRVEHPSNFVFTQNFGSIGLGLGAAVGAAAGRPDQLCVLVAGDGGFSMSIADLETAIRLNLSLLIVIMNDGGYGAEFHHMAHDGMDIELALMANPDFAAVATGFGGSGRRVTSLDELESALSGWGHGQGVRLLDVQVDPTVVDRWMTDRH